MAESCTSYAGIYNVTSFRVVSALTATAGAVTFLCAVTTIAVIFASKSHHLYHFRLVLYYCISAALFGVANCVNRVDYAFASDPVRRNRSCSWAGFFFQYTMWSLLVSILSVTLGINVKMVLRRDPKNVEYVSLFAAFVLPLLINWIPFVKGGYGQWGNYCIMRIYNESCYIFEFGNVSSIVLIGLPWTIGVITIITATVVSIALIMHRTRTRKGEDDDLVMRVTRKGALSLLWCPFVLILLVAPIIAMLLDDSRNPKFLLWGVCEILVALDPGLIALAYTTRKYLFVLKKCRVLQLNTKQKEPKDDDVL